MGTFNAWESCTILDRVDLALCDYCFTLRIEDRENADGRRPLLLIVYATFRPLMPHFPYDLECYGYGDPIGDDRPLRASGQISFKRAASDEMLIKAGLRLVFGPKYMPEE